jgi:hypothetical protein
MNNGTIGYSYELYIAASPEKVWNGLIDAEKTKQYVYGTRLQSTLKRGAAYTGSVASWPLLLSSLKSLLETGKPIAAGNS